jgi:hypothetical protein
MIRHNVANFYIGQVRRIKGKLAVLANVDIVLLACRNAVRRERQQTRARKE